jgi:hypothetical protein
VPAAPIRPNGAHAPVTGRLATSSLRYAAAVGAEAIQIFVTNPRRALLCRQSGPAPGQPLAEAVGCSA